MGLRPLWKQERKGDGTASFGEREGERTGTWVPWLTAEIKRRPAPAAGVLRLGWRGSDLGPLGAGVSRRGGFPWLSGGKHLSAMQEMWQELHLWVKKIPLGKDMVTHSSIPALETWG